MKDDIKEKLKKIKSLADLGVGGEKNTAMRMYEDMKIKYGIEDTEIVEDTIECEWFRYKDNLDRKLLRQICYMVTGSNEFYKRENGRFKLLGCYCSKFEKDEIEFYFEYYKAHLNKELDVFYTAFCSVNHLYPSESARCYSEPKDNKDEDRSQSMRIGFMASGMEMCPRPYKRIE